MFRMPGTKKSKLFPSEGVNDDINHLVNVLSRTIIEYTMYSEVRKRTKSIHGWTIS